MMKRLFLLFACVALLAGCKDDKSTSQPPVTGLTSFKLEMSKNPSLMVDAVGAISGTSISVLIPYVVDVTKLIPTFEGTFEKVMVGTTKQVSGVTVNDFTKEVNYTVSGGSTSNLTYKVKVFCLGVPEKEGVGLTSFKFEAAKNPLYLIEDVVCNISGNEISGLIPYMTDINKLIPTFEGTFDKIVVDTKVQESGVTVNDFTKEVNYTVSQGTDKSVTYKVGVFSFTGVPIVTVETEQRAPIVSKDDWVKGSVSISKTAKFAEGYQGTMKIRGRGNATWFSYPKKPYRFKLDSKSPILGIPADKDWVLLANYCDKSLIRCSIAFKLSELMSMAWTPRSHFVEYFLNGRYQGSYLLTEHVKAAASRVNIEDDGYLIERDGYYDKEPIWFKTWKGHPYTFKAPDTDVITQNQITYIKDYMNEFEHVLFSDNFKDPTNGYRKYIDVESWVNWYLVNEVLCNKDTNFYFYKKNTQPDSKLFMGPVWDFEWSLGVGWNNTEPARVDVLVQRWLYFDRLMEDPYFAGLVKERWKTMRSQFIPQLYTFINETAQEIAVSQRANFAKWNILNTPVSVEVITLGTWANEVQYLKDFLNRRLQWLDTEIPTW